MESYGEDKASTYFIYSFMQIICMNGEYLPTSGFNWLTQDEIKKLNVNTS